MLKHVFPILLLALLIEACSGPTTPAPSTHFSPTPTPLATYSLNGRVIDEGTAVGIEGATVFILDGLDRKSVATTDAAGNYSATISSQPRARFAARAPNTPGTVPCVLDAPCYFEQQKEVDLRTSNALSFELHHPVCENYECF